LVPDALAYNFASIIVIFVYFDTNKVIFATFNYKVMKKIMKNIYLLNDVSLSLQKFRVDYKKGIFESPPENSIFLILSFGVFYAFLRVALHTEELFEGYLNYTFIYL
jgi:hypothetical protein